MKTPADLLDVLSAHIGRQKGVSVEHLADRLGITAREVRKLVSALRLQGYHVCGYPGTGYFIAANRNEMEATLAFLEDRAMHSLTLVSRMRNIAIPDLIGQLHLNT